MAEKAGQCRLRASSRKLLNMRHPGDAWSEGRRCLRAAGTPALPLHGQRAIVTAWPPDAKCEKCGEAQDPARGYVLPAPTDVVEFPAPETRLMCEPCARELAGLAEGELLGHTCQLCLDDVTHVENVVLERGEIDAAEDEERIRRFADQYRARGWRVTSAVPPPLTYQLPKVLGTWWSVWFTPARELNWASIDETQDPGAA